MDVPVYVTTVALERFKILAEHWRISKGTFSAIYTLWDTTAKLEEIIL